MNMTMFWPMYFQMEQATSTTLLMDSSRSQKGSLSTLKPTQLSRVSSTKPWVKKNLKMKPTEMPQMRQGKYSAPRKNLLPLHLKLRMVANSSASAICTTEPTM